MVHPMPFAIVVAASDPEQRAWLRDLLESAGHDVVQFTDAEQLPALEAAPPDLVIAFHSAPRLEGWALCRLLRSAGHAALNTVPVLLMSADMTGVEAAQITGELGGNGLLPYPIDAGRLLLEVDRLLGRASSATPLFESRQFRAGERRFRPAVADARAGYSYIDTESLRKSEAELAAAQRIAHIGSWQWNIRTDEARWSDETFRLFGVARGALREHRIAFIDLVHADDKARVNQALTDAVSGTAEYDLEYRIQRPDGAERVIHAQAEVLRDETGKPTLMRGTVHDVTERRKAEDALRRANQQVRMLADNLHETVLAYDMDRRLIFVNPAVESLTGYSVEELRRENLICWIHPADRERMMAAWEGLFQGRFFTDIEYRLITKDGRQKWAEATWGPLLDDAGRQVGVQGSERDITVRKRAEAEQARLEEQLQQAQKMESIGRLAGGVAHDFNNLLTVINGYSQLALDELGAGDPLRATLAEIQKAGERAAGLTRQLLAFSRKQVLQPRMLDLNRVVEEMRPMLERLVGEAVEVRVELNAESGTVHADPHQLEQVIMNLSVNARDAMPDGGRLLIETSGVERDESYVRSHPEDRAGRYVMLAVSDSGTGMDEETRRRIFEPFFTTKGAGKGTGLGLSMVQGIVAQSGGYINVYSEPGHGTTLKIYLPALAEAAADPGKPADVPALGGKETVLVVEDQVEVRNYAVAVLKAYGYCVVQAENAGEALLLCERERGRIHLVLTDVVMPNLGGGELAARLRKMRPGIKVLFMSGYTDNVIVHHGALEEGAEFIQKPFSPKELASKVRAVLGPPPLEPGP
jgi:two-component system, cell cycle sensor histidine kinase and response regulator CckA